MSYVWRLEPVARLLLAWIASQYGLQVELARAKKQVEVRGELRELRFLIDTLEGTTLKTTVVARGFL